MKYQKYPAQTIKVAGDLRRAPATFENLDQWTLR